MKSLFLAIIVGIALAVIFSGCGAGAQNSDSGTTVSTTITAVAPYTPPTITSAPASLQNPHAVAVISVVNPAGTVNPGEPTIEITLENVSNMSIVSLNAGLNLNMLFVFPFGVSPSTALMPGARISQRMNLIAGAFNTESSYALTINGTFQDGIPFVFSSLVQIAVQPPVSSP